MMKTNLFLLIIAIGCIALSDQSAAGPLTSAEVTKIINRVSVVEPATGGHPATIREVIKDDLGLQTGAKSRSELLFQDNTLTRIGAETFFSFKTGTRDMTLEKGSMLLQVPKGLGGAKIHTAAVTAAITGTTIMMEYVPDQYIKILVLEGSLRVSRNGTFGDSLLLRPGKMVIMRPDAKKIPDPIDVDLEHIVAKSTLVNFPDSAPLPSMPLIQAAIQEQVKQLAKSSLVPTNLVMGHGTKVIIASNDQLAKTVGPLGLLGANHNGGTLVSLKGGAVALPILGPVVANVSTTATTAVNNLLGPSGAVGLVTNGLLGGNPTATALSISSSTQLLSLLTNAVPGAGGTITIAPPVANVSATVAALPTGTLQPIIAAGTVPVSSSSLPAIAAAGTVPILSGAAPTVTSAIPANVLPSLVSAPTTPPTGIIASATTAPLPLGLGH
jgi:hypothetical protein